MSSPLIIRKVKDSEGHEHGSDGRFVSTGGGGGVVSEHKSTAAPATPSSLIPSRPENHSQELAHEWARTLTAGEAQAVETEIRENHGWKNSFSDIRDPWMEQVATAAQRQRYRLEEKAIRDARDAYVAVNPVAATVPISGFDGSTYWVPPSDTGAPPAMQKLAEFYRGEFISEHNRNDRGVDTRYQRAHATLVELAKTLDGGGERPSYMDNSEWSELEEATRWLHDSSAREWDETHPNGGELYRGIRPNHAKMFAKDLRVGDVFSMPDFVSTSDDFEVAAEFTGDKRDRMGEQMTPGGIRLKYEGVVGSDLLSSYRGSLSTYTLPTHTEGGFGQMEREILLRNKRTWRVKELVVTHEGYGQSMVLEPVEMAKATALKILHAGLYERMIFSRSKPSSSPPILRKVEDSAGHKHGEDGRFVGADGGGYKHGEAATVPFMRNTISAPRTSGFGQDIEPHGRYMSERFQSEEDVKRLNNRFADYATGEHSFEKPLVLPFGGGYDEEANWKRVLSEHYGKKGKALSRAILADGYDGIITHDKHGTSEIVDLSPLRATKKVRDVEGHEHGADGKFVSGSGASKSEPRREPKNEHEQDILQYVKMMRDLQAANAAARKVPTDRAEFYRRLLDEGEFFDDAPRPSEHKKADDNLCFMNSYHHAERNGHDYVEGIANPGGLFPMHHAWNAKQGDGTVLDRTWRESAEREGLPRAYYGIRVPMDELRRTMFKHETYGNFLKDPVMGSPEMKGRTGRVKGVKKVRDEEGHEHASDGRFATTGGSKKPSSKKPKREDLDYETLDSYAHHQGTVSQPRHHAGGRTSWSGAHSDTAQATFGSQFARWDEHLPSTGMRAIDSDEHKFIMRTAMEARSNMRARIDQSESFYCDKDARVRSAARQKNKALYYDFARANRMCVGEAFQKGVEVNHFVKTRGLARVLAEKNPKNSYKAELAYAAARAEKSDLPELSDKEIVREVLLHKFGIDARESFTGLRPPQESVYALSVIDTREPTVEELRNFEWAMDKTWGDLGLAASPTYTTFGEAKGSIAGFATIDGTDCLSIGVRPRTDPYQNGDATEANYICIVAHEVAHALSHKNFDYEMRSFNNEMIHAIHDASKATALSPAASVLTAHGVNMKDDARAGAYGDLPGDFQEDWAIGLSEFFLAGRGVMSELGTKLTVTQERDVVPAKQTIETLGRIMKFPLHAKATPLMKLKQWPTPSNPFGDSELELTYKARMKANQ